MYTCPTGQETCLSRNKYNDIVRVLLDERKRVETKTSYKGMTGTATVLCVLPEQYMHVQCSSTLNYIFVPTDSKKYKIKNTLTRWFLQTLVGGEHRLLRKHGKMANNYKQSTGEWPRAMCYDQIFDVIWMTHHVNGHVKTPQSLHQMVNNEGMFPTLSPSQ
jgi:hypothetical protein